MKAAWEAPARPALALPPLPAPRPSLGRAAWHGRAPSGHASHTRANFHDRRERRRARRYLCSSILPGTCPRPLDRPRQTATDQGEEKNSRARMGRRKRETEKEKERGVVSGLSASSRLLLPKPASEVTAGAVTSAESLTSRPLPDLTSAGWRWRNSREEGMDGGGRGAPIPPEISCQRGGEGRAAHLGKMFYLYR